MGLPGCASCQRRAVSGPLGSIVALQLHLRGAHALIPVGVCEEGRVLPCAAFAVVKMLRRLAALVPHAVPLVLWKMPELGPLLRIALTVLHMSARRQSKPSDVFASSRTGMLRRYVGLCVAIAVHDVNVEIRSRGQPSRSQAAWRTDALKAADGFRTASMNWSYGKGPQPRLDPKDATPDVVIPWLRRLCVDKFMESFAEHKWVSV